MTSPYDIQWSLITTSPNIPHYCMQYHGEIITSKRSWHYWPFISGIQWPWTPSQQYKDDFPGMGISIMKIRLSSDRLIFIIGIPILVRRHLYNETVPWWIPLTKGSVMWTFGVFFDVILDKKMHKQSSCRWFETPWRSCGTSPMQRITAKEYDSDMDLTQDTQYFTVTGELWGV